MQPNVFSSAHSSSPAVALKASQQTGPANDDSRRANSADKPSTSEFAKMVSPGDKPADTKATGKDAGTQAAKSEKVSETAKAVTGEEDAKATGSAETAAATPVSEAEAGTDTEVAANAEATSAAVAVVADQVETVVTSGTSVTTATSSAKSASAGTNVAEEVAATSDDALKPNGDVKAGNAASVEAAKAEKSALTEVNGQSSGSTAEAGATAATAATEASPSGATAGTAADAASTPAPLKDPTQDTLAAAKAGSGEGNAVKADEAGTGARAVDRAAASGVVSEDAARVATVEGTGREGATPDLTRANATATATAALATASQGVGEQVPQTNVAAVNGPQAIQSSAAVQQLATAAPQAQVPDAPVQQLAVHVTRAAKEGADRIEIQLKPAELGRVDVKLEVGHDGRVQAVVSAERSDTLDLLRRDVQQLERALTHAGFNADKNSFSFAERGGEGGRGAGGRGDGQGDGELAADDPSAESANDNRRRMAIDRPGVDLKV